MTMVTFDALKLVDKLKQQAFLRSKMNWLLKPLDLKLSSIFTDLAVLK